MIKVAVNGFGRIGRALFRNLCKPENNDIVVTHINDVNNFSKLCYLLNRDSIHGKFNVDFRFNDNVLKVANHSIKLSNYDTPFGFDFDADIVIECSGMFKETHTLNAYLKNSSYVILSTTPSANDIPIYIYGVNEDEYIGEKIISNASCTSNAIAPIIKLILNRYNIIGGNVSVIHPFNNDQPLLDTPHPDNFRLSRNSTINIIPTSSTIGSVLNNIFGINIYGDSIRVPTSIVAFANIDLILDGNITRDDILSMDFNNKIIGIDSNMLVSSDFIGDSRSAIIASDLIYARDNMIRIGIWFDNENGYANRLIDMIRIVWASKSSTTHKL